jgi:hypothetical protein
VAQVGNYEDLNSKMLQISKLQKEELNSMKKRIFIKSQSVFDLDLQIKELIHDQAF